MLGIKMIKTLFPDYQIIDRAQSCLCVEQYLSHYTTFFNLLFFFIDTFFDTFLIWGDSCESSLK